MNKISQCAILLRHETAKLGDSFREIPAVPQVDVNHRRKRLVEQRPDGAVEVRVFQTGLKEISHEDSVRLSHLCFRERERECVCVCVSICVMVSVR